MYEDDPINKFKMLYAWFRMCKNTNGNHVTSHEFEFVKRKLKCSPTAYSFGSEKGKENAKLGRIKSHEVCSKKVQCIETGEIFNSMGEASKQMHVAKSNMCHCLKGRRPHAGGYHWRYINAEA